MTTFLTIVGVIALAFVAFYFLRIALFCYAWYRGNKPPKPQKVQTPVYPGDENSPMKRVLMCPTCDLTNPLTARFCRQCGQPFRKARA
jgi:hypothetical protein